MKKLVLIVFLFGCAPSKQVHISFNEHLLRDQINESIIDGFYDGDTTGHKDVYLLK